MACRRSNGNQPGKIGSSRRAPSSTDGAEISDPFIGDEALALGCGTRISECIDALLASLELSPEHLEP